MQFKKIIFSLTLSVCLLLSGCNSTSHVDDINAEFEKFTLNLFCQEVSNNTLNLHYSLKHPSDYGIETIPITFGSFEINESAILTSIENCEAVLKTFPRDELSKENQITHNVLSSYLKLSKEGISYSIYEEPLSPVTGIHAQLPILLAEYNFFSEEDVKIYLQLLSTLPDYFSSLISFEQKKAASGLFMTDSTLDKVLEQCNVFISLDEENYLLSTFEERLDTVRNLSEKRRADYITQNKFALENFVLPAYQNLITSLSDLKGTGKNDRGLCYYPNGKDYYSYLIKLESGTSRSTEEVISLIQNQMTSDIMDLQELILKYPTITEQTANTIPNSPTEILNGLKTNISHAFPTPPKVSVETKYVPAALEPYLSPAFYLIPTIDDTSQNTIYINNSHCLDTLHLFTTLAHEGYPGHLYQTTYYASQNPNPLRNMLSFKGYIEGWATYAEMCSYYLSPLEKPVATLLQKNNSFILGMYAMADIGIHYGGWDFNRTIDFFRNYGIENETVVKEIYELIIGDPANYLAYYVGYVEILEIKKEMIEKEGDSFSQKKFHKSLLDVGPAPFEIVNKLLNGT